MAYREKFDGDQRLDKATAKRTGDFLFYFPDKKEETEGSEKEFSRSLEARTRITGPATTSALTFYGILRDHFDCKEARQVSDVLMRLMISAGGQGRDEAVQILRGSLPKEIEISRGVA